MDDATENESPMNERSFERYSRQMLFAPIGPEGQRRLQNSRVLIVGMGALGTVIANHLVRAGVGFVRIADRDFVEFSNLQRQMLFEEEDAKQALPKAEAAARRLRRFNSSVTIEPHVTDVNAANIATLAEGVQLVLDGTDNFQTRYVMNDYCFQAGIPFVYGGAVSARGLTGLFEPGKTPCLRCLLPEGGSGGQTCDTVGVIAPVVDVVASYQATEALKYLVGAHEAIRRSLLSFEMWKFHSYELKFTAPRSDCPTCGKHEFPALDLALASQIAAMCGRDTVQISGREPLDLAQWHVRLSKVSDVSANPFLLRAKLTEGERLVLFPDGRVLVQGTDDPVRAKTLYARYIGM